MYMYRYEQIEEYKNFCDKINQPYKRFNIDEDENYLIYKSLKNDKLSSEKFIQELNRNIRIEKIDYFIY